MVTLLSKLVKDRQDRLLMGAAVVIAAMLAVPGHRLAM